jgi:hypothetical protein
MKAAPGKALKESLDRRKAQVDFVTPILGHRELRAHSLHLGERATQISRP